MIPAAPSRSAVRVVLAKPGLDGHDRGLKVIAMALRDAGAEVVYLGLRQSAERIVLAARDEDADVIGLSVLSGAHVALARQVLDARRRSGMDNVAVVIGGTIPRADEGVLRELGVDAVFPVGTPLDAVVRGVFDVAGGERELVARR